MKNPVLPQDVKEILDQLHRYGYEAYVVGGCVRDSILNKSPQDWDITTSATPQQVKQCFPHTFDTGIQHGTVTVVKNQINYEVTTYRVDGDYIDCRHPQSVQFTSQLQEDLLRRDFTMNAIAYHPETGYQDPFHGIKDIQDKIIRGVGDPSKRFQEDALRMLRAVRFAAQLGFFIEPKTKTALIESSILIKKISVERIREELQKLLLSSYIDQLPLLWKSGLLSHLHPQLASLITQHETELIAQLKASEQNPLIRWALFLQYLSVEETEKTLKHFKFDTKSLRTILLLVSNKNLPLSTETAIIKKQLCHLGTEELILLLKTRSVFPKENQILQIQAQLQEIQNKKEPIFLKDLAINGKDLQAIGIEKGKKIGTILNYLLDCVHQNPLLNQKELLLALVQKDSLK